MTGKNISVEHVASVCHEANRAWCVGWGDESHVSWSESSAEHKESCMAGVRAIVENPKRTDEESHAAWLERKRSEGWSHGGEMDAEARTHPALVEYSDLPPDQRVKNTVFRNIVLSYMDHYSIV